MKTLALLLFAILTLCFVDPGIAAAQDQNRVAIILVDWDETPIPNVTITLLIYKFNESGTTVESFPSGNCTTGQDGRCEITVDPGAPKDRSDFLRGALDLGERGKRSVIWPGGLLEVPIQLNQAGKVQTETEAGPFDNDQPGALEIIDPRPPVYLVGIILAVGILVTSLYYYRKSKGTR